MSAWIMGAATVASAAMGYSASRSAAKAAKAGADAQTSLGYDQLDLAKRQYQWEKDAYQQYTLPMQQQDAANRQRIIDASLSAAQDQQDFSRRQRQIYEQDYRPAEQQMVADAMEYDSSGNVQRKMDRAGANVQQAYSGALGQMQRNLNRGGVSTAPGSGANLSAMKDLALGQTLGVAQARSNEATNVEDKAIALRAGVSNFGRNMPNTSAAFGQLSNQSQGLAGQQSGGALAGQLAATASFAGAGNRAISGMNAGIGNVAGGFNTLAGLYGGQAGGWGNITGGLINAQGGYAGLAGNIGGLFSSPGTSGFAAFDTSGIGMGSIGAVDTAGYGGAYGLSIR